MSERLKCHKLLSCVEEVKYQHSCFLFEEKLHLGQDATGDL